MLAERERRTGLLGFLGGGFQARSGRPATLLGNPWEGLVPDRDVYLVGPIWAGSASPALRAFLLGAGDDGPHDATLRGTRVRIVTVQADPAHGSAPAIHGELSELVVRAGGAVVATIAITGASPGKTADRDSLREQIDGLFQ